MAVLVRVALLLGFVLMAFPASASALTLFLPDGTERPEPYQFWVDRARVPVPAVWVTLRLETCPAPAPGPMQTVEGCAQFEPPTIWLGDRSDRHTLLHEVGHFFDDIEMTAADRDVFKAIMREPQNRGWDEPPADPAFQTGSPRELFAEAWRACAMSLRYPPLFMSYDYFPSRRQHRRVCALINRAAERGAGSGG